MRPAPRVGPIAAWAGLQALTLSAAAAGVRVWPRQPGPPGSAALPDLVVVQLVAAALLFPDLFATPTTLAVNLALIVPFEQLAGVLTLAPQRVVLTLTAHVAAWTAAFAACGRLARTDRSRGWAVAATTAVTLGGAILWYVRAEAAASAGAPWPNPGYFGPLVAAVALVGTGNPFTATEWAVPIALAAAGCLWVWGNGRHSRATASIRQNP